MAESLLPVLSWIFGTVLMITIVATVFAVYRNRKKSKPAPYDLPKETINLKELRSPPKTPPIPIQVSPSGKPHTGSFESHRDPDSFQELLERRRGEIDPLLGVLQPGSPMKKYYSEECLLESTHSACPKLDLSLVWAPLDQSLNVSVFTLENVPKKSGSSLWIIISVDVPTWKREANHSAKKNIQIGHHTVIPFRFHPFTLEELEGGRISVKLKGKKQSLSRDGQTWEASFPIQDLSIIPNKVFTRSLTLTHKTQPNFSTNNFGTAGQLLVGLKCNWVSEGILRIQIGIKKATISKTFLPGREFKVEISIRRKDEILRSFSTKCSSGPSPDWDANYSCDLTQTQFEESVIDMTLLRLGHVKGVSKIGRASLSLSTDRNGCSHWQEALRCLGTQVQQWHSVLLLRSFVGYLDEEKDPRVGNLLVGMQFIDTRQSCKMKIVIKKLTDFEFHRGGGEYKVKVFVYHLKERINTFSTSPASVNKLVWNSSFVFHLDPLNLRNYKLNLDLIRIGRLRGTTRIGSVTLGTAENPSGEEHWEECLGNSLMEVEKWHTLYPLT